MAEEQKSVGTTIKGLDIYIDSRELEREINNTVGGFKPQALLKLIGQTHLYWINKNFVKHGIEAPWAPLRPGTLANPKRGGAGAQPLRDTNDLAKSFNVHGVVLEGDAAVVVGSAQKTAAWAHFGTRPHVIRAKQARALRFYGAGGKFVFRREVHHPGTPPRALIPSKELGERLAVDTLKAYVTELMGRGAR